MSLSSHLHSLATWNHNRCSHFTHFRGNRADDQENRKLMFSSLFAFFSYLIRSNDKETQYGTQEAVSEMEESAIMSSEYKVRNGTKEELEFSSWVRPHKQMSFSKPLVLWWHGKSPSPWFPLYNQLWASQFCHLCVHLCCPCETCSRTFCKKNKMTNILCDWKLL